MLSAQTSLDSVQALPEIEIKASLDRQDLIGSTSLQWSSPSLLASHVGELLAMETTVYLKSYGLGSLATSSIRGGSAGQTLVLWNGLPIHSPMLGQLDLALLSSRAVEEIKLNKGGGSSLWGSGAIGGVISLNNKVDFTAPLRVKSYSSLGSFDQFQQDLQLEIGAQEWKAVSKFSHQQAQNDFYYHQGPGLPKRKQTNSALFRQSFLQDLYWKLNDQKILSAHFWWQMADREIPPTAVQTRSEAYQQDQSARLMLDYTQLTRRGKWQIKAGFFEEELNYYDPQIRLTSESRFRSYLADFSGTWDLGQGQHFLIGSTQHLTEAWTLAYKEQLPQQWRSAFFASWQGGWQNGTLQLSLRQEIVDGRFVPLIPSAGLNWNIDRLLSLKAKVSRNYRLPTLNDLYWKPGGNPDLRAEEGWSQELGLVKAWHWEKLRLETGCTVFNRLIDNWILWSIPEGQSFWSANNITQVWSRGLEPRFKLSYLLSDSQLAWEAGYDYIRSTNQVSLDRPRLKAGEQLLYTPENQFFTKVKLTRKGAQVSYQHRIVGATLGQNEAIPGFQVAHLRLGWKFPLHPFQLLVQGQINNLWDANYVIIERRPMPGRHFQLSIQFSYHQK